MIRTIATALLIMAPAASVAAQVPPDATTRAQPFLFTAGMSDVFEITSSQVALMKSQTPAVRRYAEMMIAHHTDTTNGALAAAKRANILPPPPVLDERRRNLITQLMNAEGAAFDRTYWTQQLQSHEETLALMQGYATRGDTPQLRAAASATIPVVQMHLAEVRRQLAAT